MCVSVLSGGWGGRWAERRCLTQHFSLENIDIFPLQATNKALFVYQECIKLLHTRKYIDLLLFPFIYCICTTDIMKIGEKCFVSQSDPNVWKSYVQRCSYILVNMWFICTRPYLFIYSVLAI